MSDIFHYLANRAIEEAIQKGEIDNLEGAGKPIPEREGSAMDIFLKAKGIIPKEVQLRKRLKEMREAGASQENVSTSRLKLGSWQSKECYSRWQNSYRFACFYIPNVQQLAGYSSSLRLHIPFTQTSNSKHKRILLSSPALPLAAKSST